MLTKTNNNNNDSTAYRQYRLNWRPHSSFLLRALCHTEGTSTRVRTKQGHSRHYQMVYGVPYGTRVLEYHGSTRIHTGVRTRVPWYVPWYTYYTCTYYSEASSLQSREARKPHEASALRPFVTRCPLVKEGGIRQPPSAWSGQPSWTAACRRR